MLGCARCQHGRFRGLRVEFSHALATRLGGPAVTILVGFAAPSDALGIICKKSAARLFVVPLLQCGMVCCVGLRKTDLDKQTRLQAIESILNLSKPVNVMLRAARFTRDTCAAVADLSPGPLANLNQKKRGGERQDRFFLRAKWGTL